MATNVVHLLKLVFLLFFSCLWTRHAAEWIYVTPAQAYNSSVGDTLKPGDTLNSSSFLVSAKGTFALGFFRRIDSTSNESYVGISDMADPNMPFNLYVWFGNRGNPIVKHSGMLTLDNNGTLKIVLQGFERTRYGRADNCYGYYTNGGCQGWEQPVCRHGGDTFELKSGYYVTRDSLATYNSSLSISDCKALCWSDCSCVAFSSQFGNDTGCRFWTGQSEFVSGKSSDFVSINVLSSKPSHRHRGTKKWIWIGIAIVIPLLIIIFCVLCYLQRRRKVVARGNNETKVENELLDLVSLDRSTNVNQIPNDGKKGHDLSVFSYACVMTATNNFSFQNKLGEGGFGEVYMGELLTGQKIAVKRLSRNSGQGVLEFKNELILISRLQHMNLVKLLGCCIQGEERMLIYEYMPNKSLDHFLFDSNRSKLLDWQKRFSIIEGVAQGLLYLHKYSRLRVIHRDLKASNILLDENMNPKISDFGMARIFQQNESEANTKRVVGTYGYMSPEYAMEGVFSIKSDVYSFGVLMLEIVSGRKSNSFYHTDHLFNLVGYAWELWNEDVALELIDPALDDSSIKDEMLRCIHVGLLCVEDSAIDRPTMSDVIAMLTNDNLSLPPPKKPAFSFARQAHLSDKESENHSIYWASISNMVPR
ncbi:G-type lectin S-receptor-like serine/threonine-protein kinase At1g67520 isoform X1 [Fagus crenata]